MTHSQIITNLLKLLRTRHSMAWLAWSARSNMCTSLGQHSMWEACESNLRWIFHNSSDTKGCAAPWVRSLGKPWLVAPCSWIDPYPWLPLDLYHVRRSPVLLVWAWQISTALRISFSNKAFTVQIARNMWSGHTTQCPHHESRSMSQLPKFTSQASVSSLSDPRSTGQSFEPQPLGIFNLGIMGSWPNKLCRTRFQASPFTGFPAEDWHPHWQLLRRRRVVIRQL